MNTIIEQAMILAAGKGERMRPLTDHLPKPMVPVLGRPIIDYAIDALEDIGVEHILANTHYCADKIEPHLKARGLKTVYEPQLLNTGGGIKNALQFFDRDKPLMVLSGDSILAGPATLHDMAAAWDPTTMDILLLLQPLNTMVLTPAVGDYTLEDGLPVRTPDQSGEYMWTSARILNPRIFDDAPDTPFSFLETLDRVEAQGRLAAQVHKGIWHHLTTPDDVTRVNEA